MKHLAVLQAAGLVLTLRAGRTKQHFLNPVPIRLLHDRWISRYAEPAVVALVELQARAEGALAASPDDDPTDPHDQEAT
jgi:hypothetical protein